jgi:hypothetical protein
MISARILTLVALATTLRPAVFGQAAPDKKEGVVILQVFFADGSEPELGTGFFLDDDGLIATADHVLRGYDDRPAGEYSPSAARSVRKIVVHSPVLDTPIELASEEFTLRARYGAPKEGGKGFDVAVFRVPLTPEARSKVKPLDLAAERPTQGGGYWVVGPNCASAKLDETCFAVQTPQATIVTNTFQPHFDVTGTITLGFSGGPLLNDKGLVVGVASWGPILPLTTTAIKAKFTSFRVLGARLAHSENVPSSDLLTNEATACQLVRSLPSIAGMTVREMMMKWTLNNLTDTQCTCCCSAFEKIQHTALDFLPELHCQNKAAPNCPWM